MDKRHVILLALVGLIVLGVVISIVACLTPSSHSSMLPPSGVEKIDARRMDGGTLSEEGRIAFLNAAVRRLLITGGSE